MKNGKGRRLLLLTVAAVCMFSAGKVLSHRLEMRAEAQHAEELVELAVRPAPERAEESEAAVETAPIEVDFDALWAENPDVVAWLYCPDTPINYPIVQAADNAYYLRRLLDGSRNVAGTLFMDYRNAADFADWNSVVYGHNMTNGTMFGSLPKYKEQAYYDAHPQLYLLTPEKDYAIRVAAGFVTPADAPLYTAFSPDGEAREQLVGEWLTKSDFASESALAPEGKYITLSTCSYEYDNARYVLIGVLEELG